MGKRACPAVMPVSCWLPRTESGMSLSIKRGQVRLVVEQIDLRRTARHEQVDRALGLRREVRQLQVRAGASDSANAGRELLPARRRAARHHPAGSPSLPIPAPFPFVRESAAASAAPPTPASVRRDWKIQYIEFVLVSVQRGCCFIDHPQLLRYRLVQVQHFACHHRPCRQFRSGNRCVSLLFAYADQCMRRFWIRRIVLLHLLPVNSQSTAAICRGGSCESRISLIR